MSTMCGMTLAAFVWMCLDGTNSAMRCEMTICGVVERNLDRMQMVWVERKKKSWEVGYYKFL